MTMSIRQKLILLVLFLGAIAGTNGLLGLYGMRSTLSELETLYKDRVVPLRDLKEIADAYAVDIVDTNHKVRNGNLPAAEGLRVIERAQATIRDKWKAYLGTRLVAQEAALVAKVEPLIKRADQAAERLKSLMRAGDTAGVAAFAAQELYPAVDPVSDGISSLIEVQLDVARSEYEAGETHFTVLQWANVTVLVLGAIVGLSASLLLIQRSLVRPLAQAGEAVAAIAEGDLTQPMPAASRDEVGTIIEQMTRMQSSLRDLIAGIRGGVSTVGAAAHQLSSSASASAQATEQQSEAASGMAASVEELSVSVDQVDEHAREARGITEVSGASLDESGRVIHDAATGIRGIADAVNGTATTIRELANLSEQISSIVNVIREIADQTNLLALNAAIEAARAGEQGRGFAVVADEVRKLAERTATSTQEIAAMIGRIQQGAQRAVDEMEAGVASVNHGVTLAQKAGDSVVQLKDSGTRVSAVVDLIGTAIREQSAAARDIARRVEVIAQGAEENSTVVAQTAASARDLERLADELTAMASRFRV